MLGHRGEYFSVEPNRHIIFACYIGFSSIESKASMPSSPYGVVATQKVSHSHGAGGDHYEPV